MARKKKKRFIFYCEWTQQISTFPSEIRLEVYEALSEYVQSGETPEMSDLAKGVFTMLKAVIDADQAKYDEVSEVRRKAVSNRWSKKDDEVYNCIQKNTKDTNEYNCIQMNTNDTNEYNCTITRDTSSSNNNIIDNNNKNNSINTTNDDDDITIVGARVGSETSTEDEIRELTSDDYWCDCVQSKYHIDREQLIAALRAFELSKGVRAQTNTDIKDAKRHFDSWYNIQKSKEYRNQKQNQNVKQYDRLHAGEIIYPDEQPTTNNAYDDDEPLF